MIKLSEKSILANISDFITENKLVTRLARSQSADFYDIKGNEIVNTFDIDSSRNVSYGGVECAEKKITFNYH